VTTGAGAVALAMAAGAGAGEGRTAEGAATGAAALVSTGAGVAAGALAGSSLANGFLYSLFGLMTSRALGLYSPEKGVVLLLTATLGRLPRARPEPRVEPNVPNGWVVPPALGAAAVAAGATGAEESAVGAADAPDVSVSVIVLCV